ncbi:MAG: FKBP-type peptidyl-prolyl cis-trans isomerase [Bacteroidales bacterium]|nr:FKBP-type peptidyl-prolyl cis-trans isomerase [Bacteroidales bacterium]
MSRSILSIVLLFLFFVLLATTSSCNGRPEQTGTMKKPGSDEMAELNAFLVQKDRERIENYILRKNLKMSETETGLWYSVIKEGNGEYLTDNDLIVLEYECSLLDGTICYSSDESGPKEIVIGKTKIEQGLDQGLRMLKRGSEAILIIPPFLGYGFVGDGGKIPPRSIIVYKIKILK